MHLKNKRKTTLKMSTTNLGKHMRSKIERIAVKRLNAYVANFMLSSALKENFVTFSAQKFKNAWTVCPSLHITMWILLLCRPSDPGFIQLRSITSDILEEISSCETCITSVLLSYCSVSFASFTNNFCINEP